MKKIMILWIIVASAWACDTKQDVWNSGVCSPYFDGTIMDYLRADNYNWELTVAMIERAGLTDLFEGQVDTLPEITFWAPKSYSIARWLLDSQKDAVPGSIYTTVEDVPVELCRELRRWHGHGNTDRMSITGVPTWFGLAGRGGCRAGDVEPVVVHVW